jgi:transposase
LPIQNRREKIVEIVEIVEIVAESQMSRQHSPYDDQLCGVVVEMSLCQGMTQAQIAAACGNHPCERTVGKILARFHAGGSERLQLQGRHGVQHANRKFDLIAFEVLLEAVEDEQVLLSDLADHMHERLGGTWSCVDVWRALKEAGFVRKVVWNRAVEADPAKQKAWMEWVESRGLQPNMLVFMDEVGSVRRAVHASYRRY